MTTLTIEIEVGLDVPPDVLGMWISQQLNRCDDTEAEDPDSLAPHFEELDNHAGPGPHVRQQRLSAHGSGAGQSKRQRGGHSVRGGFLR